MKEREMAEVMERLRDGLSGIRAQIAALREKRALGDDTVSATLRDLRDQEEVAADRLALIERDLSERRQAEEDAARAAAEKKRAGEVRAALDRQEALAAAVLAKAAELRVAVEALLKHTRQVMQREGLDGFYERGVLIRTGAAVSNLWPARTEYLGQRARHGWEAGWPAEERASLAERLKARG